MLKKQVGNCGKHQQNRLVGEYDKKIKKRECTNTYLSICGIKSLITKLTNNSSIEPAMQIFLILTHTRKR